MERSSVLRPLESVTSFMIKTDTDIISVIYQILGFSGLTYDVDTKVAYNSVITTAAISAFLANLYSNIYDQCAMDVRYTIYCKYERMM
jgi:hypothetical protein